MTSFSLEKKNAALQLLMTKMDKIHYNGTGKYVHLLPSRDTSRSIPSTNASLYESLSAYKSKRAYFLNNDMVGLQTSRKSAHEAAVTECYDISSCARPVRTLFVPFQYEPSYTEGMQAADRFNDVKFVFVSQMHALYMHMYQGLIPANVVVLFPLCYTDVVENGYIVTMVESIGVLHSSQTTYTPYKDMFWSEGCQLFFGTEEEYSALVEKSKSMNQPKPFEEEASSDQTKKRSRTNED